MLQAGLFTSAYTFANIATTMINTILYIIAGPMFIASFSAHLYLSRKLKKEYDSDLDDYYHEFEDHHPGLIKYNKWSKITFALTALSALLLFLAAVI
jgi:hypothetical protein